MSFITMLLDANKTIIMSIPDTTSLPRLLDELPIESMSISREKLLSGDFTEARIVVRNRKHSTLIIRL